MTRRILLVSSANPYPVVTNGCARLVSDYQRHVFAGDDVFLLVTRPGDWAPLVLHHGGEALDPGALESAEFAFVLFVGFQDTRLMRRLASEQPSFCLTDTFPHPDIPAGLFRGILSHRCAPGADPAPDVLLVGGSYDGGIFHPARRDEDLVLCVGRIHPDKNQLALVRSWRDRVFADHGLPLQLVGGVEDAGYWRQVAPHVDGVAVRATVDPTAPAGPGSWRSAEEIAALCNRARLFVSASPTETFGMALIEALACGTTCVVDGAYRGFDADDLAPRLYGNVTESRGAILDLTARALDDGIRIDASAWAHKYSLPATRAALVRFVDARL
ncbi:MAG: glycosyltransferase [Acidimicrobiia bacterium]|nr:glycosyltransferase [Acidimicrobiia bacterium]